LIGATALYRRDPVFILLQASTLTSAAIILFRRTSTGGWSAPFTRTWVTAPSARRSARGRSAAAAAGAYATSVDDAVESAVERMTATCDHLEAIQHADRPAQPLGRTKRLEMCCVDELAVVLE
ncbi:MAG TPA: hypothetical protein VFU34_00865, partial [Gaiellaceae bacterium]|nr:hypothetical protein [Gaiellaceae bacterium]